MPGRGCYLACQGVELLPTLSRGVHCLHLLHNGFYGPRLLRVALGIVQQSVVLDPPRHIRALSAASELERRGDLAKLLIA
eukprot:scaffold240_cov243-Pinguiococcus_pyrenoidosus.AAC.7